MSVTLGTAMKLEIARVRAVRAHFYAVPRCLKIHLSKVFGGALA
jgi:hypothetical protein